jgi:serine/threonine-protein kinase RsbW
MMSRRESYSDRMTRRLQGTDAVRQAADAAREFGEAQLLNQDELARTCIVIEELIANLYDHGGLTGEDHVELSFLSEPEGIRVTIADPGNPFDPWAAPLRRERPRRGGGAGIDIVRAWAQFVRYDVMPEGNRLEFLLPLRPE